MESRHKNFHFFRDSDEDGGGGRSVPVSGCVIGDLAGWLCGRVKVLSQSMVNIPAQGEDYILAPYHGINSPLAGCPTQKNGFSYARFSGESKMDIGMRRVKAISFRVMGVFGDVLFCFQMRDGSDNVCQGVGGCMSRMRGFPGRRHIMARLIFNDLLLLLVLPLSLIISFNVRGFPEPLKARFMEALKQAGYTLRVKRLRFDLVDGVVAEHVDLFAHPTDEAPLFSAEKTAFTFSPSAWFNQKTGLQTVRLINGVMPLAIGEKTTALKKINALVHFHTDTIEIEKFSLHIDNLSVHGEGNVIKHEAHDSRPTPRFMDALTQYIERLATTHPWINDLDDTLKSISWEPPPRFSIDFHIDPGNSRSNEVAITASGKGVRLQNVYFDAWSLDAHLKGKQLFFSATCSTPGKPFRAGVRLG